MIIIDLLMNIILLFFPMLFLMIYFISKYIKTTKAINAYEKEFGVVFTKEVMEDMKNIPPESYNFNPAVFVPEYKKENSSNTRKEDFSQFLINEERDGIVE